MSRYHTLVRHHSQFTRKRESLDWLREQGFQAKPVYRPPLVLYGLALIVWGAIWIIAWGLLP